MTEVHNIIRDEAELQKFISWLPELKENEVYYIVLQARKKYMPELSSSDTVEIQRFTTNKERMLEKLRQLECPIGCYKTKKGQVVTDDGLVVYITTNPRCAKKATAETVKDLVDHMSKGWGDDNYRFNPVRWADRQMHKCKSRTCHVHFDIDFEINPLIKDDKRHQLEDVYHNATDAVGCIDAVTIFETRGGCHILVDPNKVGITRVNTWYQSITKRFFGACDQSGDLMLPIPGCTQGGFISRMYHGN